MTTTSLKLPNDLKTRLRTVAQARETTAHAFMLESVQNAVVAAEQQISFLADAEAAYRDQLTNRKTSYAKGAHCQVEVIAAVTGLLRMRNSTLSGRRGSFALTYISRIAQIDALFDLFLIIMINVESSQGRNETPIAAMCWSHRSNYSC